MFGGSNSRWPARKMATPRGWSVGVAKAGLKNLQALWRKNHASSSVWWWCVWLHCQGLESGNPAVRQFQTNICWSAGVTKDADCLIKACQRGTKTTVPKVRRLSGSWYCWPITEDKKWKQDLCTLMDCATMYPEAIPLCKIDAATLCHMTVFTRLCHVLTIKAETLCHIFTRLGIPQEVFWSGIQFYVQPFEASCRLC